MKKVESDRSKLKKKQIELKKKHRTAINKKKADRANKVEGELLEDIRKFLKKHGIKRHSIKDVLKPFYQFIKNKIYPPTNDIRNSSNKDYDLKLIVKKIKILTKVELREKIVRSDWTAIGHPIKVDDFDQICFVAEFGVGSHFIRSMVMCVHDEKDAELFNRTTPNEAERQRIQMNIDAEKEMMRVRMGTGQKGGAVASNTSLTKQTRFGTAWQIMTIFNLSKSRWDTLRKNFDCDKIGGRNVWDVDNLLKLGYQTQLSPSQITAVLASTSSITLEKTHPELKVHIKKTTFN